MKQQGFEPLPHQREALGSASKEIDALRPGGAEDMRVAMNKQPAFISEAANGRTSRAIQAMVAEGEIRIDAANRADRFVADWQSKARQLKTLERNGDYDAARSTRDGMTAMAKALHRDPQLESLLRNRALELGLRSQGGASMSHDLQEWLGRSRGLGIGM